jgi:type IV pilus assembly protein PilW
MQRPRSWAGVSKMQMRSFSRQRRHGGSSLVEVLVGVTVALLTVLVVYRVFGATEAMRRDVQGAGDAQQTGLFVLSRLAFDIGNAGAGIAASAEALATCPAAPTIADTLRPVTVLISDGGGDALPDSVVVRYGVAAGLAVAIPFAASAPAGSNFLVRSPGGFAVGDRAIAIGRNGVCVETQVAAIGSPLPGLLEVTPAPVAESLPNTSLLLNLGATNRAQTIRYDVTGGVLRTTDLAGKDAPNPLASNIVNLKLQYGIDSDSDGSLDTWVPAIDSGSLGSWTATALLAAPLETLRRVRAIRIGLVVRSELPDRSIKEGFAWTLFDCNATDKTKCPGRLTGFIPIGSNGGWRYRVQETVVPLHNWIRSASP